MKTSLIFTAFRTLSLFVVLSTTAIAEDVTRWLTWPGSDENAPHVVLVSGDDEYRSEEALPQLAKILSTHHGMKTTVLFAQEAGNPGVVRPDHQRNIPGLDMLDDADLMILFVRFRHLPDDQMAAIDRYLKAGKPVVGIRTATHAFRIKDKASPWHHYHFRNSDPAMPEWEGGFGRLVLGETWIAHHGKHRHQSARGRIAPGAESNDLLNGIEDGAVWGPSDVYAVRLPLPGEADTLLLGEVVERGGDYDEADPFYGMRESDTVPAGVHRKKGALNDPMMPIAWTKAYQLPGGKPGWAFTSTIGGATDLADAEVRRLLVNAVYKGLGRTVPVKANVKLVGAYSPSAFRFLEAAEWDEKQLRVEDLK